MCASYDSNMVLEKLTQFETEYNTILASINIVGEKEYSENFFNKINTDANENQFSLEMFKI